MTQSADSLPWLPVLSTLMHFNGTSPMRILFLLATLCCLSSTATAELLVILPGNTDFFRDSTRTVDVLVRNTFGTPNLDNFAAKFLITPIGTATTAGVQFNAVQSDAQLADPNYVFAGNSLAAFLGDPLGVVTTEDADNNPSTVEANNVYNGGDAVFDTGSPVFVNQTYLLYRLNITALPSARVGDKYNIALIGSPGNTESDFTHFLEPDGGSGPIPIPLNSGSFALSTLSVVVPEPGSVCLLTACFSGAAGWQLRRRRRHQKETKQQQPSAPASNT